MQVLALLQDIGTFFLSQSHLSVTLWKRVKKSKLNFKKIQYIYNPFPDKIPVSCMQAIKVNHFVYFLSAAYNKLVWYIRTLNGLAQEMLVLIAYAQKPLSSPVMIATPERAPNTAQQNKE